MNLLFWALLICMLLVAIAALVFPLLKVKTGRSVAYEESNLKINDDKIKELEIDLAEGRIDQGDYRIARDELDRELLSDIPEESKESQSYNATAKRRPTMALLVSVFVPIVALLLYLDLGMQEASDKSFVTEQSVQPQQQPQMSIEEMAIKLEQKIAESGGSVQEWTMLGRAHKHLGKYDLAAKAFAVALEEDTENAQLMLERAEMLAIENNREFTGEAYQLVEKAYALEPDNANVLWFAGVAAFQAQQYQNAIDRLLQLLPSVGEEEDVLRSIISVVVESREKLIAAGVDMPEIEDMLNIKQEELQQQVSPAVATGTSLSVYVDVADAVKNKFAASDAVFVYAKAKQGPRMPLAVQRLTLAALPATVVLDDSMAMVEGMTMSNFDELEISARVTKSGSAISQSGDFIGRLDVTDKNTEVTLNIMIDTLVQ